MEVSNNQQTMRSMMTSDYGDTKLSKEKELNSSMSIDTNKGQDEYTKAIKSIGGRANE